MPIARLSIRPTPGNRLHNLWCNNGSWWVHYTLHWDGRKRRIRRSLGTRNVEEAVRLRDRLFSRIEAHGEEVSDERPRPRPLLSFNVTRTALWLLGVKGGA